VAESSADIMDRGGEMVAQSFLAALGAGVSMGNGVTVPGRAAHSTDAAPLAPEGAVPSTEGGDTTDGPPAAVVAPRSARGDDSRTVVAAEGQGQGDAAGGVGVHNGVGCEGAGMRTRTRTRTRCVWTQHPSRVFLGFGARLGIADVRRREFLSTWRLDAIATQARAGPSKVKRGRKHVAASQTSIEHVQAMASCPWYGVLEVGTFVFCSSCVWLASLCM